MLQEFIDLNNRVIDRFCARGAREHRHPHLPRRRHGLGALQGGPLREAAEQDVPAQRRATSSSSARARRTARASTSCAGSTRATTPTACRRSASWASSTRCRPRSRRPSRCATQLLAAAKHIPKERLGATDDCGFSPVQPRREAQARLARLRARHRDAEDLEPRQGRRDGVRGARDLDRDARGPRGGALPARARACRHRGRPRRRPRCCPS